MKIAPDEPPAPPPPPEVAATPAGTAWVEAEGPAGVLAEAGRDGDGDVGLDGRADFPAAGWPEATVDGAVPPGEVGDAAAAVGVDAGAPWAGFAGVDECCVWAGPAGEAGVEGDEEAGAVEAGRDRAAPLAAPVPVPSAGAGVDPSGIRVVVAARGGGLGVVEIGPKAWE